MRIALVIEYDGRGFCGWQSQASGNGVQDAVEKAISTVANAPTRVICAGRTDTGVHALAQVVHFDTEAQRPLTAWVRGVNAHLPAGVAVIDVQQTAADFHARFCAVSRRYRYLLLNRPQRPGALAGRVGWYHRPLDVDAMRLAAGCLVGEHDFTAFRSSQCQARSPVRTVTELSLIRQKNLLVFDIRANAFLHHMVRNMVGSLVAVGSGAKAAPWLHEVLMSRSRHLAAPTFAADGLYLTGVDYDPAWHIKLGAGEAALLHVDL